MIFRAAIFAILVLICGCAPALKELGSDQAARVAEGTLVETGAFAVEGLPPQRLTIWLPPEYDSSDRRYPVLYMHDGHNVFDPAQASYGKVWAADRAVLQLARQGTIEPHIIVGMWPHGEDRFRQYMPQGPAQIASGELRRSIEKYALNRPVVSDRYLEWIAEELKPQIDRDYRTVSDRDNTAIVGSSMGGLMSCYAIIQRPDIFGRAACVSSHWPMTDPQIAANNQAQVKAIWGGWLEQNLGEPDGRKIWMDHGTKTLDAHYAPYQSEVDMIFLRAGWSKGEDFESLQFEGAEHEENAWALRLPQVLGWLLSKE